MCTSRDAMHAYNATVSSMIFFGTGSLSMEQGKDHKQLLDRYGYTWIALQDAASVTWHGALFRAFNMGEEIPQRAIM